MTLWMKIDLAVLLPLRCFWLRYQIRKSLAKYRKRVEGNCR